MKGSISVTEAIGIGTDSFILLIALFMLFARSKEDEIAVWFLLIFIAMLSIIIDVYVAIQT